MEVRKVPANRDGRVIIHFDYDCFYASVFEARNPGLKSLPFAVQQKQIIVTCNYEARRRGLHKLQLIKDAKRICPDVIIELGEDISRFRDASKELYQFIRSFSWNDKIERLGFDEVWLDITDLIDYNMTVLNRNDLAHSFLQMEKDDPTKGFLFDATGIAGHMYPKSYHSEEHVGSDIALRLTLGSHAAQYIRHQLEQQKGYTSTVGIATSKLLSKLVGNLNKPKGQTTIIPSPSSSQQDVNNITKFMDEHEIGKIPGIGFKLAQKLREFVLQRPAEIDEGLVYGGTRERVTVFDLRTHPDLNPEMLENLLSGPGSARGIGYKVWCLLHGVDDTEVSAVRPFPHQISIEDSYMRLDTISELLKELTTLSKSLLSRMRIDLLSSDDQFEEDKEFGDVEEHVVMPVSVLGKRWLAHPKTLRLTTRPRQPLQPDGTRARSFKRISHSAPLPTFVFNLNENIDALAEKLVKEALLTMFRKLHPEKAGWNLSLVNLAVTNMAETAGESRTANGRDIGTMFRRQEDVLKDFRILDTSSLTTVAPDRDSAVPEEASSSLRTSANYEPSLPELLPETARRKSEDAVSNGEDNEELGWDQSEVDFDMSWCCPDCGMRMPTFALVAHRRFHEVAVW